MEHDSEWFKAAWFDARQEDKEFRREIRLRFDGQDEVIEPIARWIENEKTTRAVIAQQREFRNNRLKMLGAAIVGLATVAGVAIPLLLR